MKSLRQERDRARQFQQQTLCFPWKFDPKALRNAGEGGDAATDKLFAGLVALDGQQVYTQVDAVPDSADYVLFLRKFGPTVKALETADADYDAEAAHRKKMSAGLGSLEKEVAAAATANGDDPEKIFSMLFETIGKGTLKGVPWKYLNYRVALTVAINSAPPASDAVKAKAVTEILQTRALKPTGDLTLDGLKMGGTVPVLADWTAADTQALGKPFIDAVWADFVVPDRANWPEAETPDADGKNSESASGNDSDASQNGSNGATAGATALATAG